MHNQHKFNSERNNNITRIADIALWNEMEI